MAKDQKPDKGQILLPKLRFEDAAAKGDVRFYLNSPYLDLRGDKPMLVATNGHILLAVECQIEGHVSEGSLGLEAIQRCRKDTPPIGVTILKFDGRMHGTGKVMFERPNWNTKMEYPKWRNAAPEIDQTAAPDVTFNPKLFAQMATAFGCGKNGGMGLKFERKKPKGRQKVTDIDGEQSISVRSSDSEISATEYHAIIMPMRF